MYGIVIGDRDMITGFRLVGVDGVEVTTVENARLALSKAVANVDLAIIIISEEFSTKMRDEIDKLRLSRVAPLIVEIPGRLGPSGEIRMSDLITKTLGIKI
jgi:V/A-type H+-transporting ATPase subunit F